MALWHLVSFPFSRSSRWRNLRMWNVALNPFVLEQTSLSSFLPDPFVVTLGPVKSADHNVSEYELLTLACLVKSLRAEKVFEIGTFDGRSSRAIAMNLPQSGHLTTLNLPPGADSNDKGVQNVDSLLNLKVVSGYKFIDTPEAARITQVFGDSYTFDFTAYQNTMDLVFIDGSHDRNYVERDTLSALAMLKQSGGWLV
ncbi:MAG TPA: class I SAM-dependent methyltransferase, partial [Prosthecobacter sp.]